MSYSSYKKNDPEFETLKRGFNLRWPSKGNPGANEVIVCRTRDEVLKAANHALKKDHRITVRSGGHCYEGFVSNAYPEKTKKKLTIIDVGLIGGMNYDEDGKVASFYDKNAKYKFSIAPGSQNWDGYVALYKATGKTLPAGSCYSVAAGGHITGGGYGLLSRLHGTTVDWLSGVDILVPAADGKSLIPKHVNKDSERDDYRLFVACRGAGGGNFGIITNYYFDELPEAPSKAYWISIQLPWDKWESKEQFGNFLNAYWKWYSDHDSKWNNEDPAVASGGLFSLLVLQHKTSGPSVLSVQYTSMDGTIDETNSQPFVDFISKMKEAAGFIPTIHTQLLSSHNGPARLVKDAEPLSDDPIGDATLFNWLNLTQEINGSGLNENGKYKSAYHVGSFTQATIDSYWKYLNNDDPTFTRSVISIDSYGGAVNSFDQGREKVTSVYQRKSVLKLQYMTYWRTDKNDMNQAAELEAKQLAWIRGIYSEAYDDVGGKPYEDASDGRYQGCYINYPDNDMKYTDYSHTTVDPKWLTLYYGDRVDDLIATKKAIDPNNVFHHEMSIPIKKLKICKKGVKRTRKS